MTFPIQKVFESEDLRRYILSYIIQKRCMSCHQPLIEVECNSKVNKWWCYDWKKTKCNKFIFGNYMVCNWCYYYVWEYI